MEKQKSRSSKEAHWRSRLLRHAQSGKTIAAFCRDESVSRASFRIWRSNLAAAGGHAASPIQPAAFIDLGTIANTPGVTPLMRPPESVRTPVVGIDIRIELGGGIILTVKRH